VSEHRLHLTDGPLTMTDSRGVLIRRDTTGEPFTLKLEPGDNAAGIAGQLTPEIRQMMSGESVPAPSRDLLASSTIRKSGVWYREIRPAGEGAPHNPRWPWRACAVGSDRQGAALREATCKPSKVDLLA
jgi:hypothetical protein